MNIGKILLIIFIILIVIVSIGAVLYFIITPKMEKKQEVPKIDVVAKCED